VEVATTGAVDPVAVEVRSGWRWRALTHERALIAALLAAVVAVTVLVTVPLVDGQPLISFTADDALISFRYSDNLANGHGPVWNLTGPRTDGYTSALWMALIAAPDAIGADPAAAAKVLGLLAALAIALMLAVAGPRRATVVRGAAIGTLALSPAFLTLAVQGMETIWAAMLATATAWLMVRAVQVPTHRRLALFNVAALLAFLTRPDLAPFVAVCVVGLGAWLIHTRDRTALVRAGAWTAGALVLPALVWALWRWSYYGYPLPNTSYAKRGQGLIDRQSLHMVRTFVTSFAWPWLLVLAVLLVRAVRHRRRTDAAALWATCVALCASGAFLAAGLLFAPIQGDLWRFQMPVFPVLLLCAVMLAARDPVAADLGSRGPRASRVLAWGAAVLIAAFALTTLDDARVQVRGRWTYDREQAGRALAPFARDGMSMFVTESGAVPYYSGWRAYDLLGLNDHYIAQHGARPSYVAGLHPDLLQFVIDGQGRPGPAYDVFRVLLRSGQYQFALATVKTNRDLRAGTPPQAHFYFVRRDAPHASEVRTTLERLGGVRRLEPALAARAAHALGYPG
jgi:hypothetical protein